MWWDENPEQAEEHLLRAQAIARQLDDRGLEVDVNLKLAALALTRGDLRSARAALGQATTQLPHTGDVLRLASWTWDGWLALGKAQNVPDEQVALLWAIAALHAERYRSPYAATYWKQAELTAAATEAPEGRQALAARAQAALTEDGGRGLLAELFGLSHTEDQARSNGWPQDRRRGARFGSARNSDCDPTTCVSQIGLAGLAPRALDQAKGSDARDPLPPHPLGNQSGVELPA